MGYQQIIAEMIEQIDYGVMFSTSFIVENLILKSETDPDRIKKIVNTSMNRLIKTRKDLVRFQKGIYYKTKMTKFGAIPIDPLQIAISKYVKIQNKRIGYETGPSLSNLLGMTTLMPKHRYFASNVFRNRGNSIDPKLGIVIRKPRTLVTEENYKYLQLLDLLENKEKVSYDIADPVTLLLSFVQNYHLDFGILLGYAKKYYPIRTLSKLAELATRTIM